MDLDVHKLELRRQELLDSINQNASDWRHLWEDAERVARHAGASVQTLPSTPTVLPDELARATLLVSQDAEWITVDDILSKLRSRVLELRTSEVPTVDSSADALSVELRLLNSEVDSANRHRIEVYKARQLKAANVSSIERRISSLQEDMQKNQDVQKIQRYSGTLSVLTPDRCPTCEQRLVDTLLPQDALNAVMPIEDNIEYIRAQLKMFQNILNRELEAQKQLEMKASQADRELNELYERIRAIREELLSPAGNPSAVAIEGRIRLESKIRELESIQAIFIETLDRMQTLAALEANLRTELSSLPKDKLSNLDHQKLQKFTRLLQDRASDFGFSTFDPGEISINEDTYRPQKEGYEIGFETSASDAIRLKWAYQLGLLELDQAFRTNHPGLLLLDEPRQQSSSRISFGNLLARAAKKQHEDQQIIVSTSEDLATLQSILQEIDCNATIFDGYVIAPVE